MKVIKVCHIITRLDRGGSATNTVETVARLNPSRYETFLICGLTHDPDGTIETLLRQKNIRYKFIPELVRDVSLLKDVHAFFTLLGFLRQNRFDIVHTHSSKAGILGRWAARFAGVKHIIHTPHGHVFYGYFSPWLTAIFLFAEQLTARITDKIITLTEKGKTEHVQLKIGSPEKFIPVYSGIDINAAADRAPDIHLRDRYGIHKSDIVIGTVTRLVTIKGVEHLIRAVGSLRSRHPNVRLMIIGEGPLKDELAKFVSELALTDSVVFCGFHNDPLPFFHAFDIFCLPSLNEGMGRVILEAMACGKPVVASDTGGIPELVQDGVTGFLCPIADPGSIAAAIEKLINNNQLCREFGAAGKKAATAKFSIEKMISDIENIYTDALSNK